MQKRKHFQEKRWGPGSDFPHECSESAKRIPISNGHPEMGKKGIPHKLCKAKNKDGLHLQCDHNFHFK